MCSQAIIIPIIIASLLNIESASPRLLRSLISIIMISSVIAIIMMASLITIITITSLISIGGLDKYFAAASPVLRLRSHHSPSTPNQTISIILSSSFTIMMIININALSGYH